MVVKINESKKRVNEELRNFTIVPYADEEDEAEDYTAETALDAIKDYKSRHVNDPHIYQVYDESDIYYDPETGEEIDESLKEGNPVSNNLSPKVDQFLQDLAQFHGHFNYNDIMNFKPTQDDIKSIRKLMTKYNEEAEYGDDDAEKACDLIARDVANIIGHKGSLKEDIDSKDYQVVTVAMDVAMPADKKLDDYGSFGSYNQGKLYKALESALASVGLEMAGDYVDVVADVTKVYKDNDYEFFLSESKKFESLSRYAQSDSQEETISFIEKTAKDLGLSLRYGTSVGKEPKTVILDHRYQDGVIRVSDNGACEINGEWIGHYRDDYVDINDYEYEVTEALRELLAEDED